MYKIYFNLSEEDYWLVIQFHVLNSTPGKKVLTVYRLILPVIFFVAVFMCHITEGEPVLVWSMTMVSLVASGLWIITSKYLYINSLKKGVKKLFAEGKPGFFRDGVLLFEEEFMQEKKKNLEMKIEYEYIEKCFVTEKAVYFYYASESQVSVVPLYVFPAEEDKQKFLSFLRSKLEVTYKYDVPDHSISEG